MKESDKHVLYKKLAEVSYKISDSFVNHPLMQEACDAFREESLQYSNASNMRLGEEEWLTSVTFALKAEHDTVEFFSNGYGSQFETGDDADSISNLLHEYRMLLYKLQWT